MSDGSSINPQQQKVWATGDFAVIGATHIIVGEVLCETIDLHAGSSVLDVACGSGGTTLAAARRDCDVTGLDFVPALLERGRERAAAEQLPVTFIEGDAEALPFADATFDCVLSTFGVMFAPHQDVAAREMLRVCRPGGVIGLASWTPDSFVSSNFQATARFGAHPATPHPPSRWGTEEGLRALFGDEVEYESLTRRHFVVRHRTPNHCLATFREFLGPVRTTFDSLDAEGQEAFAAALLENVSRFNTATDGTVAAPSAYLEAVLRRQP